MKVIPIKDEIYHATIFVIPQSTEDELVKFFQKKYGVDYKHDNGFNGLHYTLSNDKQGFVHHFVIFTKFKNTTSGVSLSFHEIFHLVCSVLKEVGLSYSESSEEAYAYYISYLTKKVLEKLV